MNVVYKALIQRTEGDIACLPGQLEVAGKRMLGDLSQVVAWRDKLLPLGLQGVVAYHDGFPRGFAEFMPAQTAPAPILAPGAAVLLCYHWAGTAAEDAEHLAQEEKLVSAAMHVAQRSGFSGMATLGWDHPTHFPIDLLRQLGFQEVEQEGGIALMWKPFRRGVPDPSLVEANHEPADLSTEGLLAVDVGYSTRCPYAIHHTTRLEKIVKEHPLRSRIRYTAHRIDTRQQALAVRPSPCDWWWVRFNGEEVCLFLPRSCLEQEIDKRLRPSPPPRGPPGKRWT